jgi:dihydrofolate reductase
VITLVAAFDRNRAIGQEGGLPWHLPDDLRRFKALTLGKPVLMGRKTAHSLKRALPERENLVLSRTGAPVHPGMTVVASLDAAIEHAGARELMVIGGGEVYALALPRAVRMHLTLVDDEVRADTWFPAYAPAEWRETARAHHDADARHAQAFDFVDLERR